MTIQRLIPRSGATDVIGALEAAAREALQGLEDEDLAVSFGVWEDGDALQFVCKVETPPGDPLSSEPPWRWWSSLFSTPEELGAQLSEMVGRRRGNREPTEARVESDATSALAS